jgi:DNA polymerase III subunit delta'
MDFLKAKKMFWLDVAIGRIRQAAALGRFPHSLLLLSAPGLGVESLAQWTLAFALCDRKDQRPCGECASCLLLKADNHPDALIVRVEEDAKQIKVEQVRALIEALTLKSYRGGYKVGLIEGAELLNVNGANAFLKTLEEPTQDTLLILTANPNHRLPATVSSRCLRLKLRAPALSDARAWLKEHVDADRDWDAALSLAGGAPLLACDIDAAGLAAIDTGMRDGIKQLSTGEVDVTLLAEQWVRSHLQLRILWLENWITTRVRLSLGVAQSSPNGAPVRLPDTRVRAKICQLYELLDSARQFRRLSQTGMNQQLALETLLQGGLGALSI